MIDPSNSDDKILEEIEKVLAEVDKVYKAIDDNEKEYRIDPVPVIEKGVLCRSCKNESLRYYESDDILKCDTCGDKYTGYMFLSNRVVEFSDKDYKAEDLI